jgi:hypothetical protein
LSHAVRGQTRTLLKKRAVLMADLDAFICGRMLDMERAA